MLLQDWSHHNRSFMVVIMNCWIVMLYPSAPWKLILFTMLEFPPLFSSTSDVTLYENSAGFSLEKQRMLTMLLVFSRIWVVHLPLFLWLFHVLSCACLFSLSSFSLRTYSFDFCSNLGSPDYSQATQNVILASIVLFFFIFLFVLLNYERLHFFTSIWIKLIPISIYKAYWIAV